MKTTEKTKDKPSYAQEIKAIMVNTRHVSCDGGDGPLGHPKVFYEIKKDTNKVSCGYCGKTFVYKSN